MVVEKVDFPFIHEHMIQEYQKTIDRLGAGPFAAIACDQGGHEDYEIYNACKYARDLIQKELDELAERRKALYAELSGKYGRHGTWADWYLTMDGSVHLTKEGHNREPVRPAE